MADNDRILAGAAIGILGGGQLGRMAALAAANLGYRTVVLAPESDPPASQVAARTITADYLDDAALNEFARMVDVVTVEFENVPSSALEKLADHVPVRPGAHVLSVAQDRLLEKRHAEAVGAGVAPYAAVSDRPSLDRAVARLGRPSVLKTRRFGYDGKGQVKIGPDTDLGEAWAAVSEAPSILEGFVDFAGEMSVIVARSPDGVMAAYEPVWNEHENHILRTTTVPAPLSPEQSAQAVRLASAMAEELDVVGLLAVEMFLCKDGSVLVNEIAPRPHNSGHWTMNGAATSQFEQLVRAICNLPLGSTRALGRARMLNLLGDEAYRIDAFLEDPDAHLHLYGKAESRPGRKMGHVNWLFRD